jgi:hypothetical protein
VDRSASVQAVNPNCSSFFSAASQDKAWEDTAVFTITGVSVILKISKVVLMIFLQVFDCIGKGLCERNMKKPFLFYQTLFKAQHISVGHLMCSVISGDTMPLVINKVHKNDGKINDFTIKCLESNQEPTFFVQLFNPLFFGMGLRR